MSVLISGSLAYDTVFSHSGRFADSLRSEKLDCLNLTFQADTMRRTLGGCAGNIAYSLKQLGGDPLIWSAVGHDAGDYLAFLQAEGIRTDAIEVIPGAFTAQCVITTDALGCQLTAFHSGAMEEAARLRWPSETPALAILAPTSRGPMTAHSAACRAHGVPYLFDAGQTIPLFSGEELLQLAEGAFGIAFSDYEAGLVEEKTGLDPAALSRQGKVVWQTHGARGSTVWEDGHGTFVAAPETDCIDPVGAGDAYRGGLLFALSLGLSPLEAARTGTLMGAAKVCTQGPVYRLSRTEAARRYRSLWGDCPF